MGDKKEGQGRFEYSDGAYHEGKFYNDKFDEGNGTVKYADGSIYKGEYKSGRKDGMGKLTNTDGTISYESEWILGRPIIK